MALATVTGSIIAMVTTTVTVTEKQTVLARRMERMRRMDIFSKFEAVSGKRRGCQVGLVEYDLDGI
jgi:hypothetical protein